MNQTFIFCCFIAICVSNGVLSVPIKGDSQEVEDIKQDLNEKLENLNDVVEPEVVDPNFQPNEQNPDLIERNIIIENENETQYYRGFVEPGSNITTIIRLTNLINNTNIINMPTTLNNTNINNIHLYNNKSSTNGGKYGLGYTKKGQCCFAVKPKACRQTTSGLKCHHKRVKTCGRQCTAKLIHPRNQQRCQWPYMGCSGNYQQQYPYYPQPFYPQYPPQNPSYFDDNDDDDDDDGDNEDFPDENDLQSGDWAVVSEKCKFVSEDGIQITNCTQAGELNNPFARHTVDKEAIKRETRHISKKHHNAPQQYYQQQPYPYQPYLQQMPVYYVPVQAQAPSNYFYPPQYQDNDEDDDSYEIPSKTYNKRYARKKRHHIIEEDDTEL